MTAAITREQIAAAIARVYIAKMVGISPDDTRIKPEGMAEVSPESHATALQIADAVLALLREAEPHVSATRPWVNAFADAMEAKLAENRHKGDREGWASDNPLGLLERLREEVGELEAALYIQISRGGMFVEVAREAADVGNFAMMIADVAGDLRPAPAPEAARPVPVEREPRVSDAHVATWCDDPAPRSVTGRLALDLRDARAALRDAHANGEEQARLLGMGGSREAALQAKLADAVRERDANYNAYVAWHRMKGESDLECAVAEAQVAALRDVLAKMHAMHPERGRTIKDDPWRCDAAVRVLADTAAIAAAHDARVRAQTCEAACKAVCDACARGMEVGCEPAKPDASGHWYHANNDKGGLLDMCEANEIRRALVPPTSTEVKDA